jgi:hypothetical protein
VDSSKLRCSFCGHVPVSAVYWQTCPKCGFARPPAGSPYTGRGALLGLGVGGVIGAACGYITIAHSWQGLMAGAVLGAIPGLLLVFLISWLTTASSRLSAKR